MTVAAHRVMNLGNIMGQCCETRKPKVPVIINRKPFVMHGGLQITRSTTHKHKRYCKKWSQSKTYSIKMEKRGKKYLSLAESQGFYAEVHIALLVSVLVVYLSSTLVTYTNIS